MRIPSGVITEYIYFVALDSTDLVTRETGLATFTVYRSRNGGAATLYTTPTIAEISAANMPGVYALLIDEDTTIDAGYDTQEMCLHITHAGMAAVSRTIELYRAKMTLGETLPVASSALGANTITASSLAADAGAEIADAFLDRNMATGTDSGSSTVRTPRQALRFLRNKWASAAGTLTVNKEDDATASWTAAITSTAGAAPITAIDPAGP